MADWQLEQRKQRGEHIDDTAEARSKAREVLGGLKSFFIGDTPSEMAFNAATAAALPLKALRVPMMGLSALTAADDAQAGVLSKLASLFSKAKPQVAEQLGSRYLTKAAGPAKSGQVFTSKDLAALQEALTAYGKAKALDTKHADSFQMLMQAAEKPNTKTHVLYANDDYTQPISAFQLDSEHGLDLIGDYMPNLVSLENAKGAGTQALQEARRAGPYGLVATQDSKPFYEKMLQRLENFQPATDKDLQGIAYQYKKKGGLVAANSNEADDDFAYPGMF